MGILELFWQNFLIWQDLLFSAKINEIDGAEFTQRQIAMIREKYALSPRDVVAIFLIQKCPKKDTRQLSIMEYNSENLHLFAKKEVTVNQAYKILKDTRTLLPRLSKLL